MARALEVSLEDYALEQRLRANEEDQLHRAISISQEDEPMSEVGLTLHVLVDTTQANSRQAQSLQTLQGLQTLVAQGLDGTPVQPACSPERTRSHGKRQVGANGQQRPSFPQQRPGGNRLRLWRWSFGVRYVAAEVDREGNSRSHR